jgi:putative hemolysin
MTEPPFMMEHTTAYKALERFKKLEFIMLLYLMNTEAFKGVIT